MKVFKFYPDNVLCYGCAGSDRTHAQNVETHKQDDGSFVEVTYNSTGGLQEVMQTQD